MQKLIYGKIIIEQTYYCRFTRLSEKHLYHCRAFFYYRDSYLFVKATVKELCDTFISIFILFFVSNHLIYKLTCYLHSSETKNDYLNNLKNFDKNNFKQIVPIK